MAAKAGESRPAERTGLGILSAKKTTQAKPDRPQRIRSDADFALSPRARKRRPASMPTTNSGSRTRGLKLRTFFQKSVISPELILSAPSGWRNTYANEKQRLTSQKPIRPRISLLSESFLPRRRRNGNKK